MSPRPNPIAERLKLLEGICRSRGVPCTVQRRTILQAVVESNNHPTADEVLEAVKGRLLGLSRTTVYRVLDALADWGVIRRLQHAGGAARFDGKTRRHHHLVCNKCHKVIDLDDPGLDRLRLPRLDTGGFAVEDFSVHLTGTCPACRRKKPARPNA
jgi:Fur family peroxide stress response transcriptional regulator